MNYVSYMLSPEITEAWSWFQKIAPDSYFEELITAHHLRSRKRTYWLAEVVWLMIYQRLARGGSLASAVSAMAQGGGFRWQGSGGRGRPKKKISAATGGYCQARQRLPTLVAAQVSDRIFDELRAQAQPGDPKWKRPIFVIDGSTLRLSHEADLVEAFPPGHNQHGENHWPVMLIVAFHDAHTGLAARPSWGPMYGPQAVSEQHLAEQALARLPAEAVVLADGAFGIFAFAHAVQGSQRPVLLRLTAARAQKILGRTPNNGTHRKVVWKASRWDQQKHPELPAQASLEGWVVVCRNPSRPREKLYLFTTLDLSPQELLALYKLRWNIETDLRSLKRTVDLHHLHSKAVAMAEKEIVLAVAAYNLVRAIMFLAAQRAGLAPRQLSFAGAHAAVMAALPGLDRASSTAEYKQRMDLLLDYVMQARLPHRKRKRSCPRRVWGHGASFPTHPRKPINRRIP
jgi:putative transposase